MDKLPDHFVIHPHPLANPEALVFVQNARFTVLTERMIRMEYSSNNAFEDRPSQIFWFRRQPAPEFEIKRTEDCHLEIETPHLCLRYQIGKPFSPESLSVYVRENGVAWKFGDVDQDNLKGTLRTLDEVDGQAPLEAGLISRAGWTVIDDSQGLVFQENGWLTVRANPSQNLDLYFLGYGHAYQVCLTDFGRLSGFPGIPPRWVLGNWWSRYWAYTQEELSNLMLEFQAYEIPLSVCIVDMDWHITKTGNPSRGWTGYTWNRDLFPDPQAFIHFLHSMGLKTALNLHPADGIWPHEEMYEQMAIARGIDPASQETVPFNLEDPEAAIPYFKILHHPQEEMGVDFWWMDWQQGNPLRRLKGLNLLWWINHLHYLDLGRAGKRSFIFSRWGGLGNQRYPIGFSGDTVVSWASLAFQPYLTATAANVGFGWWSHDIGGHMRGVEDAELYTRWVQFGVFSPVMRLHSTANPYHERRPWGYDSETLAIARQALRFRHALIPYLYTMAWRNHAQGIVPIRPMYYLRPDDERAYSCPNQYSFGSELIVAPFISPRDPNTRLSRQVVWLPEGEWFDFFTGSYYSGDSWNPIYGDLQTIPVFAKAGAIIPLGPMVSWGGVDNPDSLTIHVFPGADNQFNLYEDAGDGQEYLTGEYALTPFSLDWGKDEIRFEVEAVQGNQSLLPQQRSYAFVFHMLHEPMNVEISSKGEIIPVLTQYDLPTRTLTIPGMNFAKNEGVLIRIQYSPQVESPMVREGGLESRLKYLLSAYRMPSTAKAEIGQKLTDILEQPEILAAYRVAFTNSQLRAFLELITGTGMDQISNAGEERIILWNNEACPKVTYRFSCLAKRFLHDQGLVPEFKLYHPQREFEKYPARWDLDYFGLYQESINKE